MQHRQRLVTGCSADACENTAGNQECPEPGSWPTDAGQGIPPAAYSAQAPTSASSSSTTSTAPAIVSNSSSSDDSSSSSGAGSPNWRGSSGAARGRRGRRAAAASGGGLASSRGRACAVAAGRLRLVTDGRGLGRAARCVMGRAGAVGRRHRSAGAARALQGSGGGWACDARGPPITLPSMGLPREALLEFGPARASWPQQIAHRAPAFEPGAPVALREQPGAREAKPREALLPQALGAGRL